MKSASRLGYIPLIVFYSHRDKASKEESDVEEQHNRGIDYQTAEAMHENNMTLQTKKLGYVAHIMEGISPFFCICFYFRISTN